MFSATFIFSAEWVHQVPQNKAVWELNKMVHPEPCKHLAPATHSVKVCSCLSPLEEKASLNDVMYMTTEAATA